MKNPRSSRSVLNYMCACDTSDPVVRESLNTDEKVEPLLRIWFQSGSDLDEFCQPFASVIRELKNSPATLVGDEWDNLEGKVAKVLLADQLSRSCFRDSPESFSFDHIGRKLVRELVAKNAIIKLFFAARPQGFLVPQTMSLYHLVEKPSGSNLFISSEKIRNSS